MLAIDLFVQGTLTLLVKRILFAFVSVFVGVALEGLPCAKRSLILGWMLSVQVGCCWAPCAGS